MSYEFTKLNEVESVSEMPEGSKLFINDAGTIKQCDAGNIGGCKIVEFEVSEDGDEPVLNSASMTPDEVRNAMMSGVVIGIVKGSEVEFPIGTPHVEMPDIVFATGYIMITAGLYDDEDWAIVTT